MQTFLQEPKETRSALHDKNWRRSQKRRERLLLFSFFFFSPRASSGFHLCVRRHRGEEWMREREREGERLIFPITSGMHCHGTLVADAWMYFRGYKKKKENRVLERLFLLITRDHESIRHILANS